MNTRRGVVGEAGARGKRALVVIGFLVTAIVAATPGPGEAHGRLFIGVGPSWGWGWGYATPYYGYPYGYRYGYPYAYPPVVVEQQPRVYIQQAPPAAEAPAPPAPTEEAYWYYCPNAGEYYPNVPSCSEPWVRVPARVR